MIIETLLALCLQFNWECRQPMIINSFRKYQSDRTVSLVYVNGKEFGEALEDAGRPQGVKIPGETCIPEGVYQVRITYSRAFKKDMMVLFNHAPDHSIRKDDIFFNGIRVHAGTNIGHTAGCPLLNNYEELQKKVQQVLDKGEEVYWVINRAG